MKPLPVAPPTLEDSDIWLSIVVGYGLDWATAGVVFRDGDRRDAALMWAARYARYRTFPVDLPPLQLITPVGLIDCGGALWDADPVWRHRDAT